MKLRHLMLVGVVVAVGCGKGAPKDVDTEPGPISVKTAKAEAKDIRETLPVDGTFVPAQGDVAKLAPVQAGKLATVLVKEGDTVKAGQLLASIDIGVLSAQQSSAAAGAASANAQAKQSEIGLKAANADYQSNLRTARLGLETAIAERNSEVAQAQTELDRVKAGARPQEIAQAEQSVRQAQVSRDKASADYERNKKLFAEGYVSGQDLDASKAAFDLADSALAQAKQQLGLVKEGARKEEVRAAELKLSAAKDLGDKKIQQARSEVEKAQTGILSVKAKESEVVSSKTLAMQKSADALAASKTAVNGQIRAPFDGVISRRLLSKGDSADPTTPVFELVRKGAKSEFVGSVSPQDAGRISKGMLATLRDVEDSRGTVVAVGIPDSQSGQIPVRIAFEISKGMPSAGSSEVANVVLRTINKAIAVPQEAVVTKDGKSYVYVVKSGVVKLTEIGRGPTDNGFIGIEKGLNLGDEVVLIGQNELADGGKVEVEKPEGDDKKGDAKKDDDKKDDKKDGDKKEGAAP